MIVAPTDESLAEIATHIEVDEGTGCWIWTEAATLDDFPRLGRTKVHRWLRAFMKAMSLRRHPSSDDCGLRCA